MSSQDNQSPCTKCSKPGFITTGEGLVCLDHAWEWLNKLKQERGTGTQSTQQDSVKEVTEKLAQRKAQVADLDAELNGGVLAEVGEVAGKPLFIRVDHNDMARATYEVDMVRNLLHYKFEPEELQNGQ